MTRRWTRDKQLRIQMDDVDIDLDSAIINFEGTVSVIPDPASENKVTIIIDPSLTALGKDHGYEFFNNGSNLKDKWLDYVGANVTCDDTPGIITGNSKLRSISFTNSRDNADIDVEIYRNGIDVGDLVFTWQVRNSREAWKTNGLEAVTFSIGDEIRVFMKDASGPIPSKAVIKIIVISTDDIIGEGSRATLI